MAINKKKNVMIQVTFPKEDAEQLNVMQKAFVNNGIKITKSDILLRAFRDYLKIFVWTSAQIQKHKEKQKEKLEELQGDKKNA